MSLTYGYNRVSGAQGGLEVQAAATASTTIFSHLNVTNINLNVAADTSQAVNAQAGNAAGLAKEARADLTQVGDQISRTKGAAIDSIKTAQAEIIAAARANGVNEGDVFPDTRFAPDSVAEMFISAVPELKGGGSLATHMMKSSSGVGLIGDIANGMRDRPQEEVLATIRETLISNSGPQQNDANMFSGLIVNADDSPKTDTLRVDWEALLDQHPDALEQIMYFDENNLTEAWPELAELDAAERQVDDKIAEMAVVENNAVELGFTADGVEVAGELPPAEIVAADAVERLNISSLPPEVRQAIIGGGLDRTDSSVSGGLNRENELLELARAGATLENAASF